ncbi:MAG TPA: uracil-DNA glycosylase [Myxococcota bacterium]|nr:uracil-DNA glycosylase [Myxococcota bacterium]HRY92048.1 uracil-DNA glycosylase [Myxococcota bacterium]HSA24041.1 uracil-DNA glycosylase [Myxococcota bacterium]
MTDDVREELGGVVRGAQALLGTLQAFGLREASPGVLAAPASGAAPVQPALFAPAAPGPEGGPEAGLQALRQELGECTRCKLHRKRRHIVFGEGDARARLLVAGEGPGADEDRSGRPFVGEAGQLLERILAAMGLGRERVYICNVVKCRPPSNRQPEEDEVATCAPFLERQIEIIRPSHILCLGATAARRLIGLEGPLGKVRGRFHDHPSGARVMPTYHPAYLLRNPLDKKLVWDDVKQVMAELGLSAEGAKR